MKKEGRSNTLRRIVPALGLFFFLSVRSGVPARNISIAALPVGLVLSPMYGGGAVLIREAARRAGRGWPTILLLASASRAVGRLHANSLDNAMNPALTESYYETNA